MAKPQTTFPPDLLEQISQSVIDADAAYPYTGARDDNPQFLDLVLRTVYGLTSKVYGAGQYIQWIVEAGVARRPNPATVNKAVQGFRVRLRENASIPLEITGITTDQRARLQQAASTFYATCFESASATFEVERMELKSAVDSGRALAAGLQHELDRGQAVIAELRRENAALLEGAARLNAQLERTAAAQAEEEKRRKEAELRLAGEREKLGAQIEHLQAALASADDARKFALLQIEEARSETRAWREQHEDARKALSKSQAESAASREREQHLALEHAQARARADSLSAEVERISARIEAVVAEKSRAQEAERAANAQVMSLEAMVGTLQQEIHAAKSESLGAMLGPLRARQIALLFLGTEERSTVVEEIASEFGPQVGNEIDLHLFMLDGAPVKTGVRKALRDAYGGGETRW
ncbi:hypothetical protein [Burkholderia cepacia]|uniref:hypothetical protein n=1 Tax=Burkholderia cepacia TaxID=292 RepID=UPI002AB78E51|nr:hypothetical protein [Burkholderia cepacia]